MSDLTGLLRVMIYTLMAVSVIWAVCAVTLRSLFRSALAFTGVLIALAGLFIALHAEFLAVIQVLIYVGAVMTLIIFAIMLTEKFTNKEIAQNNNQSLPGAVLGLIFVTLLSKVILSTPWPITPGGNPGLTTENTKQIGHALLTDYLFPFEVLAIILTAVVIGAVVIAKKEEKK